MSFPPFARNPEPLAPTPEPWPEIGETWKPEGVTVAQRYYNQAHAVVLVYTPEDKKPGTYYTVACLGCHFSSMEEKGTYTGTRHGLAQAARVANEHATTCRALPRDIPARPDDEAARKRLHAWVSAAREHDEDVRIWLTDLDLTRLTIQRTNQWIAGELQQLAVDQPEILRTERSKDSDYVSYYVRGRES
ncbi:hypothetical protein [Streptomyces sp. NPDC006638]|uniref:hypothetical protein n=1 Tax=Streptomyces sp. NPDC006638 TaxID=3157183 RepID=UPI0033BBE39C